MPKPATSSPKQAKSEPSLPPLKQPSDQRLITSLDSLSGSVQALDHDLVPTLAAPRQLFIAYLKGILGGLGAITAVAIVIPFILWMLHEVSWVPLIGDFVTQVAERMEQVRR